MTFICQLASREFQPVGSTGRILERKEEGQGNIFLSSLSVLGSISRNIAFLLSCATHPDPKQPLSAWFQLLTCRPGFVGSSSNNFYLDLSSPSGGTSAWCCKFIWLFRCAHTFINRRPYSVLFSKLLGSIFLTELDRYRYKGRLYSTFLYF